MGAKDTVIVGKIISLSEGQQRIVDRLLEQQAEISFRAGIKEVVDWLDKNATWLPALNVWKDKPKEWEIKP